MLQASGGHWFSSFSFIHFIILSKNRDEYYLKEEFDILSNIRFLAKSQMKNLSHAYKLNMKL